MKILASQFSLIKYIYEWHNKQAPTILNVEIVRKLTRFITELRPLLMFRRTSNTLSNNDDD